MERKRRFQTRAQYAEEKANETKFQKVDKKLHYLIAIVAVLIVLILGWNVTRDTDRASDTGEQQTTEPTDNETESAMPEEQEPVDEPSQATDDELQDEEEPAEQENGDVSENTVSPSTDPDVKEVQTNPNWPAYPTQQTGTHVSTYEKGHIDYEEKLKAIFSVTDLQQGNSIVKSVRNNGGTEKSIGIVTSMDKTIAYRVSIEWINGEGWKPVQLEVLN